MVSDLLRVDPSPVQPTLATPEGDPVWPAWGPDDLQALRRVAATFGARLDLVTGRPGPGRPRSGVVVALGRGVEAAASLYAHLTSRHSRKACEIADLSVAGPPDVVVTTPPWLREDLFHALYEGESASAVPGILCADSEDTLRRQVLVRSAAAVLQGRLNTRRIDLLLTSAFSVVELQGQRVLGCDAEAQEVRCALREGAGVLTVMTHSDGIDAFLGKDLVLCPMDRVPLRANPGRLPRCQETGFCHRRDQSMEEALGSGRLAFPQDITARIFVLASCCGVLPPDAVVEPVWGLLPHLLASPTLGAVVTTAGVALLSTSMVDLLAGVLSAGASAGEALALLLRFPEVRRVACRFVLFGDPGVRLPPESSSEVCVEPAPSPAAISLKDPQDFGQVGFLYRAILHRLFTDPGYPGESGVPLGRLAAEALEALQQYEIALWSGTPTEGEFAAPGPRLRRALLPCICLAPSISVYESWLRFARLEACEGMAPRVCRACREPYNKLTSIVASFTVAGVLRRRISFCPRCGFVEDAPLDSDVTLSVIDGVVRLEGRLPSVQWIAGLRINSRWPPERYWWEWPAASEGGPARLFEPPRPWPPGPLTVALVLLHGSQITIVSQTTRRNTGDDRAGLETVP